MVTKADLEEALKKAQGVEPAPCEEEKPGAEKGEKQSQASKLAELVDPQALFHDEAMECYARVPVDTHFETHRLNSDNFKRYLVGKYYFETGKAPSKESISSAILPLEAIATYQGECRPAFVRLGEANGAVYVDLGGEDWSTVEITASGWSVRNDAPVALHRPPGLKALPMPSKDGDISLLRRFLNVDEDGFILSVAWIIGAHSPKGPYPVEILDGEHGSSKSTNTRFQRGCVDPHASPLRSAPKCEQDLIIAANNSRVVALDNLSTVHPWLSDGICRLATGGGFSARKMYTDRDEQLFSLMRPVILNGIGTLVGAPDLADRGLFIKLQSIRDCDRLPEKELFEQFDAALPSILGGIYDAVSEALRNLPNTKIKSLPRMADFALWVCAAEPALPWAAGRFLEVYGNNRASVVADTLENSRLGAAVMAWARGLADSWQGTASELLAALEDGQSDGALSSKGWPKSPSALSRKLAMFKGFLRQAGIEVDTDHRIGASRAIRIVRLSDEFL